METNKSHSRSTDDYDRKRIWLDLPYNSKLGKLEGGGAGRGEGEVRKIFNKENKTLF